jgi:hypothetical protein
MLDGNVGNLKVLRMMRCARLIKLVRIIKASAMLQKLKRRVGLKYSTIKLIQFVVMVVVITHWLSCLWMLIPRIEATDTNWIGKYYHKQLKNVTVVDPVTYDIDASQLYLACLYWSTMTLTTIGKLVAPLSVVIITIVVVPFEECVRNFFWSFFAALFLMFF